MKASLLGLNKGTHSNQKDSSPAVGGSKIRNSLDRPKERKIIGPKYKSNIDLESVKGTGVAHHPIRNPGNFLHFSELGETAVQHSESNFDHSLSAGPHAIGLNVLALETL